MSVIAAASVGIKTMADGTLRITCDIEPVNAQAAFQLFGSPGTPMALAALKVGHAAKSDAPAEPEKLKGGKKALDAALVCQNPEFQKFAHMEGFDKTEAGAREFMCERCGIVSRAELDHSEVAARLFAELMAEFRTLAKVVA